MERQVTNPATLAPLGSVPECGAEELDGAVRAAAGAAPVWGAAGSSQRAAALQAIGAHITATSSQIAALASHEGGQPRCESLDAVRAAAASFEFYAQALQGGSLDHVAERAEPARAVAVLTPFPYALPAMAAAAARALAHGHCVLHQPPRHNPLASLELAKSCAAALPPGTLQMLTGGAALARALVAHAQVGAVALYGSTPELRDLGAHAHDKRLDLQTAGGGPHIVCAGADLQLAVAAIAWTRLAHAGQALAGGHLYVERPLIGRFIDCMHPCIGLLDVDDPFKSSTDLGPVISVEAARHIEDQVGQTLREGAKLILGGRRFRPSGLPGHFFQQTILTEVRPGSLPTREPIAGPVITITPVADLEEALRLWSESAAARAAREVSIYTGRVEDAQRRLEAYSSGFFRINDPSVGRLGPFGALSHRGIRVALGAGPGAAKSVESAPRIEPKPWWFPYSSRT